MSPKILIKFILKGINSPKNQRKKLEIIGLIAANK